MPLTSSAKFPCLASPAHHGDKVSNLSTRQLCIFTTAETVKMTQSDLDLLLEMGFERARAELAVKKTGGCESTPISSSL